MQYLLVQNKTIVHLGPITWKPRMIQTELNDLLEQEELKTSFTVPQTEQGYILLSDGFEIFPISQHELPAFDPIYEHLEGPLWTYENDSAAATYNVKALDLGLIKTKLKQKAADERVHRENLGTILTLDVGVVNLKTDFASRSQYATIYSTATDSTTFKSNGVFLTLTKDDLLKVVTTVNDYIHTQFAWEKDIWSKIDAASDSDSLKSIVIVEPVNNAIKL
jgi:hypothetical protein